MGTYIAQLYLVVELPDAIEQLKEQVDTIDMWQPDNTIGERVACKTIVQHIHMFNDRQRGIVDIVWPMVDNYECPLDGSTSVGPLPVSHKLPPSGSPERMRSVIDLYSAELMKRLMQGEQDD